jgi:hypothetical protein
MNAYRQLTALGWLLFCTDDDGAETWIHPDIKQPLTLPLHPTASDVRRTRRTVEALARKRVVNQIRCNCACAADDHTHPRCDHDDMAV